MSRPSPADRKRALRRRLGAVGFHLLLWASVGVVLVPVLWPLLVSLNRTTLPELLARGAAWWLRGVDASAVSGVLFRPAFLDALVNSLLVATASALLGTALAATGAYALSRFEFAGRRTVSMGLLALLMVPKTAVALPLFLSLRDVGLFDTRAGLVLASVAFALPFVLWLVRPFIARVPPEQEDAALVDGCTRFGAFVRVFLPSATPALAGAFTLAWLLSYNELLFATVLLDDPAKRTLPVAYSYGVGDPGVASLLAALPVLALFAALWGVVSRYDVERFAK